MKASNLNKNVRDIAKRSDTARIRKIEALLEDPDDKICTETSFCVCCGLILIGIICIIIIFVSSHKSHQHSLISPTHRVIGRPVDISGIPINLTEEERSDMIRLDMKISNLPDTQERQATFDNETNMWNFECPHCGAGIYLHSKDLNCQIMRHGAIRIGNLAVPHQLIHMHHFAGHGSKASI